MNILVFITKTKEKTNTKVKNVHFMCKSSAIEILGTVVKNNGCDIK